MHYKTLVIHKEDEYVDSIIEPFYGKTYDWKQEASARWKEIEMKDGTKGYEGKMSNLDLEKEKFYYIVFDNIWFGMECDEEWEDFLKVIKSDILPKLDDTDYFTVIDVHN